MKHDAATALTISSFELNLDIIKHFLSDLGYNLDTVTCNLLLHNSTTFVALNLYQYYIENRNLLQISLKLLFDLRNLV